MKTPNPLHTYYIYCLSIHKSLSRHNSYTNLCVHVCVCFGGTSFARLCLAIPTSSAVLLCGSSTYSRDYYINTHTYTLTLHKVLIHARRVDVLKTRRQVQKPERDSRAYSANWCSRGVFCATRSVPTFGPFTLTHTHTLIPFHTNTWQKQRLHTLRL